jgi:DNA-binding CsgD family transcriptional regulator
MSSYRSFTLMAQCRDILTLDECALKDDAMQPEATPLLHTKLGVPPPPRADTLVAEGLILVRAAPVGAERAWWPGAARRPHDLEAATTRCPSPRAHRQPDRTTGAGHPGGRGRWAPRAGPTGAPAGVDPGDGGRLRARLPGRGCADVRLVSAKCRVQSAERFDQSLCSASAGGFPKRRTTIPPLDARRSNALIESLSEHKLEVLQLLAGGALNQAIAEALVISIGMVKSHINHILGKLAACNRTEAVSRAPAELLVP